MNYWIFTIWLLCLPNCTNSQKFNMQCSIPINWYELFGEYCPLKTLETLNVVSFAKMMVMILASPVGIDRFFLGDWKMGSLKLGLMLLSIICFYCVRYLDKFRLCADVETGISVPSCNDKEKRKRGTKRYTYCTLCMWYLTTSFTLAWQIVWITDAFVLSEGITTPFFLI